MVRDRLQDVLDELAALRKDPSSESSLAALRRVIVREASLAVARAARIVAEAQLTALAPGLVAAFSRLLEAPAKKDPGCVAKQAIASALVRLEHDADGVFRAGIRHRQLEGVWGGQVDTAVELRSTCGLGLARSARADVPELLAELLADPEPAARVSAARAIAAHGGMAAPPLLRHKALAGDEEPRVVVDCLVGLLQLDPAGGLSFVTGLLEPTPVAGQPPRDRSAQAVAALGESRLKEAFPVLRDFHPRGWQRGRGDAVLRAMAALRRDEGFSFLLSLVREADGPTARAALAVLTDQQDASLEARLREAAWGRGDLGREIGRERNRRETGGSS